MSKFGPPEVEIFPDPETGETLLKICRLDEEYNKIGIILNISDNSLHKVPEGSIYPRYKLPVVRKEDNFCKIGIATKLGQLAKTRPSNLEQTVDLIAIHLKAAARAILRHIKHKELNLEELDKTHMVKIEFHKDATRIKVIPQDKDYTMSNNTGEIEAFPIDEMDDKDG